MDEKLYSRRKAVPRRRERRVERGSGERRISNQAVDSIGCRVDAVVAHHHIHPWVREPLNIYEATAKRGGRTASEPDWNGLVQVLQWYEIAIGIYRQQVHVVPEHIQCINLHAAAIVEGKVTSDSIERLTGCKNGRHALGHHT